MADTPVYRKDFRALAELRAEEARALLRNRRQLGAYYLAGYAVECALKACIAKQKKRFEFPPKRQIVDKMYGHNLSTLLDLAGLKTQLDTAIAANADLAANWNTVKEWTVESRYETSGLNGRDMYNAVTGPNGVLPWIRLRW
jgi:hypothetical protein